MTDKPAAAEPTFEEQTAGFEAVSSRDGAVVEPGKPVVAGAAAEAPAEEAEDEDEPEAEVEEETPAVADGAAAEKPKKAKPTAQERINDITKARREAERQLDMERGERAALERRLAAIETRGLTEPKQGATSDPDAKPKPDDFPYGELDSGYIEALAEHKATQVIKADRAATTKQQEAQAATAAQAEVAKQVKAFEEAGAKKFDDFEEVMEGAKAGDWKLSPTLGQLILSSDVGPDIARHLSQNPKEAAAVFGKAPLAQAAYFGRLEAKFSSTSSDAAAKPAVKTTQAPPPVKSAKGAGSKTGFDPATASFEEFEAHYRASQK